MPVPGHPMRKLKGTAEGKALMNHVRSHKKGKPVANFDAASRQKLEAKGETMAGGRYPIRNAKDLANAYKDYVRTGRPADVAAWIGKRAKELGLPNPITANAKDETAVALDFVAKRRAAKK